MTPPTAPAQKAAQQVVHVMQAVGILSVDQATALIDSATGLPSLIAERDQLREALRNRIGAWLIVGLRERDDFSGEPLYWSNKDGWVDVDVADRFSDLEMRSLNLPMGGVWCSVQVEPSKVLSANQPTKAGKP